jgi:hypothetical protein
MDLQDYKKAFAQAQADLEKLTEEREEIDRKISKLKQAIIGLAPLADDDTITMGQLWVPEWTAIGITDMIREILSSAEKPLTPVEVRDRLLQMKPEMKEQVNLMASIHTVLKRLVPREAYSSTSKTGDIVYRRRRRFHVGVRRRTGAFGDLKPVTEDT